jgi:dihydropteroate synthase
VVDDVHGFLRERVRVARAAGVEEVWVDPGIGFGKTTAHNLALLGRLEELVADGTPVVVGTSRKRSLGVLLARSDAGMAPHPGPPGGSATFDGPDPVGVGDRLAGSLSTATWAMILGARMVRVHDVGATAQAVAVAAAAGAARAAS